MKSLVYENYDKFILATDMMHKVGIDAYAVAAKQIN
jgi:hypothetical protein